MTRHAPDAPRPEPDGNGAARSLPRRGRPIPGAVAGLVLVAGLAVAAASCSDGRSQSAARAVPQDRASVARDADRARVKGDSAAPVRVIEVADFQCPYCRQYFEQTFGAVDSLYVQTGLVRYVWLSFPSSNHERAWPAVEAAFCAGAAGRFWPMHDTLFARQGEWSNAEDLLETFVGYARSVGVEEESFRSCLVQDRASSLILRDFASVVSQGVGGTPFFVVGDSVSFQGAQPLSRFRQVIDSALVRRGVEPPR